MSWQRQVLASRGYLELGMFEDATLALEQMKAEHKTRREVSYAALVVHLAAKNWDMAVTIAADIVRAEPKDPATWILLAHAVRHAGNVEQMEMVLFKARAWHPRDPLILFKLACCASVTGRAYRVNREGFTGKGERMTERHHQERRDLLRDTVASPPD